MSPWTLCIDSYPTSSCLEFCHNIPYQARRLDLWSSPSMTTRFTVSVVGRRAYTTPMVDTISLRAINRRFCVKLVDSNVRKHRRMVKNDLEESCVRGWFIWVWPGPGCIAVIRQSIGISYWMRSVRVTECRGGFEMGGYLLMNRPIKVSLFQYEPNAISSTDWPWTRSGSTFEAGKLI